MGNQQIRLLIGADIVPTQSNIDAFQDPQSSALTDRELAALLQQADYRIFNLECPLTDRGQQADCGIDKVGPRLSAPVKCVNGLKALQADFVTLANNHILDYGAEGLADTRDTLQRAEIAYAGVGLDPMAAAAPFYAEIKGIKIGIYCCAEHEFSIVSETHEGANPFDPMESPEHIARMRCNCDYLIVLYHGGTEFYRYPSPQLQRTCRKCVEKGADLVLCQHSHCIGALEKYYTTDREGTILYGQGNYLFDRKSDAFWDSGLLVEVSIAPSEPAKLVCHPIIKKGGRVYLAQDPIKAELLDGLCSRSEEIRDPRKVKALYADFVEQKATAYIQAFLGKKSRSILFRLQRKLFGRERVVQEHFSKADMLKIQNSIECEAHRELLLEYLKRRQ